MPLSDRIRRTFFGANVCTALPTPSVPSHLFSFSKRGKSARQKKLLWENFERRGGRDEEQRVGGKFARHKNLLWKKAKGQFLGSDREV
jgi:hypothetical protein